MRAYLRTSQRTGISMPFWLVPLAAIVWVTVMVCWWLVMLAAAAVIVCARHVSALLDR